jgi:hypothetical protein
MPRTEIKVSNVVANYRGRLLRVVLAEPPTETANGEHDDLRSVHCA